MLSTRARGHDALSSLYERSEVYSVDDSLRESCYVVYMYWDYRKDFSIEIHGVYGNLEDAIAYAETICVPEGSEEDTAPEYVTSRPAESMFDRKKAASNYGRIAIDATACHLRSIA